MVRTYHQLVGRRFRGVRHEFEFIMDIIPCNCRECEEVGCKQSVVTYRALLEEITKID